VTTGRALWIILVRRPKPRRPYWRRERWGIRIWWWPVALWPPFSIAFGAFFWAHGDPGGRWGVGVGIFWLSVEVLMLMGWWEEAGEIRRANRRRLQHASGERAVRIADLERELGFGAYDEIRSIRDLEAMRRVR